MKAWVGEESTEYRAVCVYSRRPGAPKCGAVAAVHVLVNDGTYGVVALASCETHAPLARATAPLVAEHVYEGVCGFPGTLWDDLSNRCVIDESGEEPLLAFAAARPVLTSLQ